jgi:OOP family OmpA-OmpF porin
MSQLDELRQIIVGDNTEQLSELKRRIEDVEARTKDVAEVLAPAIDANVKKDDRLIDALKRPVSEGLKQAIRLEPETYADILYPAIAPSIRAAISQAISSMLATINQTIESATSVDSLQVRFKSWRTGIPYSELLLQQSLLYRVEHLYLIDRESGLLIAESGSAHGSLLDSDAVSAMFSAIQSFVQDSFSGDQHDRLTDFKVGSHNVWIAHGPRAMLACVIFGTAPESLKSQLYDTLDGIRTGFASELAEFDGDNSKLSGVENHLQPMMRLQKREEDPTETSLKIGTKIIYLIFVVLLCYWVYLTIDKSSKLAALNHYLDATPGVVVTKAYWQNKSIVVDGLQDPDATLPMKTLSAHGITHSNLELRMTPFRSLEIEMELRRFRTELSPPAGTQLQVREGQVVLSGTAPLQWLLDHDRRLRQLATDKRLNISELYASVESIEQYLDSRLRLPNSELRDKTMIQFSETPWTEISFSELVRELMRTSRR